MRIRVTVAAATGALALSALAAPAAQAAEGPGATSVARSVVADAVKTPADESHGDTAISNVVVNGGKDIVLGTTTKKTFTVSFTAKDNSGVKWAQAILWHGANFDNLDGGAVADSSDGRAACTKVNATTSNCKAAFTVKADVDLVDSLAGGWKVWAIAQGTDADYVQKDNVKGFQIQRLSKLTVNAAPEPVKKGKTITVTGALTRASWNSGKYLGYTGQSVKLQFKKKGATTYTTVKTIKTTTAGALKTTVTASVDGAYRYSFAGTTTTPGVSATGDSVDVQ
ncbi:calcium-binding protein [Streptomyces fagopyri]|uniref:Calcium-binding protein n=1 Tax=Streptomyces fagopyri TaxID=2662397 RepID=A0A5Q0LGV8_9ACTN|nr:calcium-binding protein [Streptomyces fagopyri]QFZ75699.1 calcium-binding protein [Streptomyces fagopyri]